MIDRGRNLSEERNQLTLVVRTSGAQRLDSFLVNHLAWKSRSRLQGLIREGRVTVNGEKTKASRRVRLDDLVEIHLSNGLGLPDDYSERKLDIIYEDEWLVAVNKPPGMLVHPVGRHVYDTLINYLHHRYHSPASEGEEIVPKLCHRLDRDTSGVVVLAKEGQAKCVPLGSAEEIDKLCLNYGNYLKDDRITDEQYVPLLRSLYDRLMAPIAKVAPKDAKTWIISPASQINFVNFATFLTPKERFVCEDYTIKYVASGRDLVPPKGKKPKTNPQLVVFANPKYENKPPTLAVVTRDVGETTLNSGERNDLRASILRLKPLSGTQKEAESIAFAGEPASAAL